MRHKQGKRISLTHWPLIILPQALKITAWRWRQAPACTNPPEAGRERRSAWLSSLVVTEFKTLMPLENTTQLDREVDVLRVRRNGLSTENILLTTATYPPSLLICCWHDAHPALGTLCSISERAVNHPSPRWGTGPNQNLVESTYTPPTSERRSSVCLTLPPAKPLCSPINEQWLPAIIQIKQSPSCKIIH